MAEITTEEVLDRSDKLLAEVEASNEESRQRFIGRLVKAGKNNDELQQLDLEEILGLVHQQSLEKKEICTEQQLIKELSELKDQHGETHERLMKKIRDSNNRLKDERLLKRIEDSKDQLKHMDAQMKNMENRVKNMENQLN